MATIRASSGKLQPVKAFESKSSSKAINAAKVSFVMSNAIDESRQLHHGLNKMSQIRSNSIASTSPDLVKYDNTPKPTHGVKFDPNDAPLLLKQ